MERTRTAEDAALAEANGPRVQALRPVVLEVEERVEEIEARDPESTAAPIAHASHGAVPVTASQAPTGASPRHAPSQTWQSHVIRFRYG